MDTLTDKNTYITADRTPSWFARNNPTLVFYTKILSIIFKGASLCKKNAYGGAQWIQSSLDVVSAFESIGGRFQIENLDAYRNLGSPCIFIGNHMSIMETFVLPCLIRPHRPVTFVIKESLVSYPYFGHVMRSRNPIVVGRTNPREDFKIVLEQGQKRIEQEVSVIIFPQTTRSDHFDPTKFNSLGVKLARRCQVPIVPIALKTDAWENGNLFKDAGRIKPKKTVHICFGDPYTVKKTGKKAHQTVVDFITDKMKIWG